MAKENTPGSQKPASSTPKTPPLVPKPAEGKKPMPRQVQQASPATPSPTSNRAKERKEARKGNQARIGGRAVSGAKSTQPKPPPTSNNPSQQQVDSYNRDMRRRMERLGTGPQAQDEKMQTLQQRRRKRVERRKERLEEKRADLRKSLPNGGRISLGRRNTYFLIAVVAILIVLVVLFLVLRQFHIIGG